MPVEPLRARKSRFAVASLLVFSTLTGLSVVPSAQAHVCEQVPQPVPNSAQEKYKETYQELKDEMDTLLPGVREQIYDVVDDLHRKLAPLIDIYNQWQGIDKELENPFNGTGRDGEDDYYPLDPYQYGECEGKPLDCPTEHWHHTKEDWPIGPEGPQVPQDVPNPDELNSECDFKPCIDSNMSESLERRCGESPFWREEHLRDDPPIDPECRGFNETSTNHIVSITTHGFVSEVPDPITGDPNITRIKWGDKVTWKNDDPTRLFHTTTENYQRTILPPQVNKIVDPPVWDSENGNFLDRWFGRFNDWLRNPIENEPPTTIQNPWFDGGESGLFPGESYEHIFNNCEDDRFSDELRSVTYEYRCDMHPSTHSHAFVIVEP